MTPGTHDPEQAHEPLLRHFRYEHFADERLRSFSGHYARLARIITNSMGPSAERTLALRDLVRAKDQGVRALLDELFPAINPPPNRNTPAEPLCAAAFERTGERCSLDRGHPVHQDRTAKLWHLFVAPSE